MHCSKARWRWWVFWQLYLQFGDLDNVCKNYAEMWLEYYEVHSFDTANNVNGENGHEPDSNNGDTGPPLSLVIFLDNSLPLEVPCPHNMDDRAFLQHIARFYYLQKMRKGLLEVMGFKTLGVVEVVEMQGDHNNRVVGRSDTFLGLGRYDGNRIIYFLRKPEAIGRGSRIVRFLREKGVLTEAKRTEHRHNNSWANSRVNSEVNSGANSPVNYDHGCSYTPRPPQPVNFLDNVYNLPFYQLHNALNDSLQDPPDMHTDVDDKVWALNFVSTWHTNFAALAVVAPVIASMIVSIAWPAIAVLKYGEDMQTSVQTGFTVGSYVVTAGAVLIALVTFAASVYDSNTKYTKDLQSQTVRV
ncbi:hypothetical protein SBRCBS47491_010164 [Sporothrix bragantina]|uniref:Uncharacterized protein n=1 Tax=Sporothrix bragantina TaxID=671064 RepID=A0ABP0D3Y9_9PEZI